MSETKRQVVAGWIQVRIKVLALQSYALLALMAALIAYGFFISGKALETTNADLQDVRQSAERVRIMGELEQGRFRMVDLGIRVDKLFRNAASELDKVVNDTISKYNTGSTVYTTSQTRFFQTDFEYSVVEIQDSWPKYGGVVVQFAVPAECANVAKLNLKRKREEYFLFIGENFLFDWNLYAPKLAAVRVQKSSGGEAELPRELQVGLLKAIQTTASASCSNINSSQEMQQVHKAVSQTDDLLAQLDDMDARLGVRASASATSNSTKLQDAGAVALLLANRFGPLVIIFFFSSLIITLYKYNSRLVSFYYARLYALEASGVPISDAGFASAVSIFSPDGVDFGRVPRTPVDIAGDIATKVVEKIDVLKDEKPKSEK